MNNFYFNIQPISDSFKKPERATEHDAGLDVFSTAEKVVGPFQTVLIPLGFKAEFAPGYVCDVRTRSGLALKEGLVVLNSPGTIDAGYRGEWGVILRNVDGTEKKIKIGDKIAQLVFLKCEIDFPVSIVDKLSESQRGEGGYGSTGK